MTSRISLITALVLTIGSAGPVLAQSAAETGTYVLYLLQQANRAHFNPALEYAVDEANRLGVPVLACFGLLDGANGFPEANARLLVPGSCARSPARHQGAALRDAGGCNTMAETSIEAMIDVSWKGSPEHAPTSPRARRPLRSTWRVSSPSA